MNKTIIGILVFILAAGVAGVIFLFFNQDVGEEVVLEEAIFETDETKDNLEQEERNAINEKLKIEEKDFSWNIFWRDVRDKGCYDVYETKDSVEENNFDNKNCFFVDFEMYTCSDIEEITRKYPELHNFLLDDNEKYVYMWENREICGASERISIGGANVENRNFIILIQLGGMNEIGYPGSTNIFEIKDGKYIQILDKKDYLVGINSICNNKWLVGGIPMYLFEEGRCCPSNSAIFYYKIKENELVIDKIVDGYENDISDIYFDLIPCN
jgi:hypothetical protein